MESFIIASADRKGAIGANVGAIFNSEEEKVMFEIMESCSKSDLKDIESFNNRKDRKEAQQKVCNDQIDGFGRKR